jgi:SnoaL-like domain
MPSIDTLLARIAVLEERLGAVEDREAITRLQYQYGFYLDNRLWREVVDLFADEGASVEIGRRGVYLGKERIFQFMNDVLGQGRRGLLKDEIINHIQLQMVITLARDRHTAKARSRALVQGNSPPGSGSLLCSEGIYENDYVKEGGTWKIQRLWWVPTFYCQIAGFDRASFQSGPESREFPPDRPSAPPDAALGRSFIPFHYAHPITDALVPSPASGRFTEG